MSLRWGEGGSSAWDYCHEHGIIAMGYYIDVPTEDGYKSVPVVRDCSKITEGEFDRQWRVKWKENTNGRASLHKLAYEMNIGDIVYIKEGTRIVGRGKVISDYKFDAEGIIKDNPEILWEHYREIQWDEDFKPIDIKLGSELTTVLELDKMKMNKLLTAEKNNNSEEMISMVTKQEIANKQLKKENINEYFTNFVNAYNMNEGLCEDHQTKDEDYVILKVPVVAYAIIKDKVGLISRPITQKLVEPDYYDKKGNISVSIDYDITTGAVFDGTEELVSIVPCNTLTFAVYGKMPGSVIIEKKIVDILVKKDRISPDNECEKFLGYEFVGYPKSNWVARLKELWINYLMNAWEIVEDNKNKK